MSELEPPSECRFDAVSLGEVMLRVDPGEGRIHTTPTFSSVGKAAGSTTSRALRRGFGLRTAVVTALADEPVGRGSRISPSTAVSDARRATPL